MGLDTSPPLPMFHNIAHCISLCRSEQAALITRSFFEQTINFQKDRESDLTTNKQKRFQKVCDTLLLLLLQLFFSKVNVQELGSLCIGIPQEHGCVFQREKEKHKTICKSRTWFPFHRKFPDLSGWGDLNNTETTKRWWSTPLMFGLLDLVC